MTDDDLSAKLQRIKDADNLADCLRATLDYYAVLTEEDWWPLGEDSPDFKRGAMREDRFWRTQIEGALLVHTSTDHPNRVALDAAQVIHPNGGQA